MFFMNQFFFSGKIPVIHKIAYTNCKIIISIIVNFTFRKFEHKTWHYRKGKLMDDFLPCRTIQ